MCSRLGWPQWVLLGVKVVCLESVSLVWSQCGCGTDWLLTMLQNMVTLRIKDLKNSTNPVRMAKLMFCATGVSTIVIKGEDKGCVCAFSCIVCARTHGGWRSMLVPSSVTSHSFETSTLTDPGSWEVSWINSHRMLSWHTLHSLSHISDPGSVTRTFLLFHFPLISN